MKTLGNPPTCFDLLKHVLGEYNFSLLPRVPPIPALDWWIDAPRWLIPRGHTKKGAGLVNGFGVLCSLSSFVQLLASMAMGLQSSPGFRVHS